MLGSLLEAGVVVCAVRKKALRPYLFLNLYMAASLFVSLGRYNMLQHYGLQSIQYAYFYYYSDALLTILLYFALTSLYSRVFGEMNAERAVRLGAVILLAGTALFSYGVVHQAESKLVTRFVVEMSQNLYFVGLVLTYVLWAAVLKLRETRTRLIQLVLSLGVYFSLLAANYALRNLYPSLTSLFQILPPLVGCFLPAAWMYAFWRVPDEARLAPARLAVIR
ncbi:MAG TPA: hypothetical protein VFP96_03685 [Candidatus Acidoferrum sp.]|nr:hypothetical protein [Candidatus Acidoferrum sp.]